jgi:ubiquitin carboxyl-terminal hydrolase 5/13
MVEQAVPCEHWAMNVNTNLQGMMIYKDECTRCFLTPKHEKGLNVCLSCY